MLVSVDVSDPHGTLEQAQRIRSRSLAVDKQHNPSLPRTFPPDSCFVSEWPHAPENKIKMRSMVIT